MIIIKYYIPNKNNTVKTHNGVIPTSIFMYVLNRKSRETQAKQKQAKMLPQCNKTSLECWFLMFKQKGNNLAVFVHFDMCGQC